MPESIYPSPADPEAQIRVFDMRGRLVRQWVYLMDGPGHPLIIDWDGRTTNGSPASSGWYIFDIRFRNHPLREGIRFKMLRIRGILDSTYDWSWF